MWRPYPFLLRIVGSLVLLGWTVAMIGAAPIDLVRIRASKDSVQRWFPIGTELRSLTIEELDELVSNAQAGLVRASPKSNAKIVRIDHEAHWDSGSLVGRSKLTLRVDRLAPSWIPLGKWSPAIEKDDLNVFRTDDQGHVGLYFGVEPTTVVEVEWRQRARANSAGRVFSLSLPNSPLSRFSLDLPLEYSAHLKGGIPSEPSQTVEKRRRIQVWTGIDGDRELFIRSTDHSSDSTTSRPWITGPTLVEVEKDGAHWSADWTIDFMENSDRSIEFELDAPLELIDVKGVNVSTFSTRRTSKGMRVMIHFAPALTERERVMVTAICPVPTSGIWTIPASRPLESIWLGGRTTVRVDSTRTVLDCQVRSGRKVISNSVSTSGKPAVFSFEPTEPVAVADLTFGESTQAGSVAITGVLRLEESVPRMVVQARWSPRSGAVPYYALEFPADWSVSRVEYDGDDEPLPWRSDTIAGGRSRVILIAPPAEDPTQAITFNIYAQGRIDDPSAPFDLPRVRAIGALRDDECWVALTRHSDLLKPIFTQSLAWLNPDEVLTRLPKLLAARGPDNRAIAWRWLGDKGEGRACINPAPTSLKASIIGQATIASERIDLGWKVEIEGTLTTDSIVVQVDPAPLVDPVWTLGDTVQQPLLAASIALADREALGLGNTGAAWRISLSKPVGNSTILVGRVPYPLKNEGAIPLLFLSDGIPAKMVQVVRATDRALPTFRTVGLQTLSMDAVSAHSIDKFLTDMTAESHHVGVYSYEGRFSRLSIQSNSAVKPRLSGLINEAVQSTIIEQGGNRRDRLLVQLAWSDDPALRLSCPPSLVIDKVTRDGQVVEVTQDGEIMLVPLGFGNGPRTIVVDYHQNTNAVSTLYRIQSNAPSIELPCATFVWEVTAPKCLTLQSDSEELRESDIVEFESSSLHQPQFKKLSEFVLRSRNSDVQTVSSLDLNVSNPDLFLVEALLGIDPEQTQIIVDRLALFEIGLGPRSKLPISPRPTLRSRLENLGLILIRREAVTLVTTSRARPNIAEDSAIHSRLEEAMLTGSDRDDRLQTVERWRDETTPRGYRSIASEFWMSKDKISNGWVTHRFIAPTWPRSNVSLVSRDTSKDEARQWIGGGLGFSAALLVLSGRRRTQIVSFAQLFAISLIFFYDTEQNLRLLGEGGAKGMVGALTLYLGRSRKSQLAVTTRNSSTNPHVLARFIKAMRGVLVVAIISWAGSTSLKALEDSRRILVVLPYETVVDAASPARQALIRLEDDVRLRSWAKLAEHRTLPIITLLESAHRVKRSLDSSASVESSYEIEVTGSAPAFWTFPIGDEFELSAFVDDVEFPVLIAESGREGIIRLITSGRHRVRVIRQARLNSRSGNASIDLPIVIAPRSKVEVSQTITLENRRWVDILSAHGELKEVAGGIVGSLGPSERLIVSWRGDDGKTRVGSGLAESVILWDSTPVGDLARVRLTLGDPAGTHLVRLAIDPGTSVRPTSIPGLVSLATEGTAQRPEWVVKMDPPLAPGSTIGFDLWRPIGVSRGLPTAPGQEPSCSPPGFIPMGLIPYSGIIGFRRPSDWNGRLVSSGAVELSLEESFAKSWGQFPDDSLTFAGVTRFSGEPLIVVRSEPAPIRPMSQSLLSFELTEARAEVRLETKLHVSGGDIAEAELIIPEGFHLRDIRADALTATYSPHPSRLILRFDGKPSRSRSVVLTGWMEARITPLLKETRRYAIDSFLFRWVKFNPEPTSITLKGETKFDLESSGPHKKEPPSELPKNSFDTTSITWTLESSAETISIRWNVATTKLVVSADNTLTISDDGFLWMAKLTYQIEGNPLEVLYLKVPNTWSSRLRVETPNQESSTHSEVRGEFTYLTVRPAAPAWGLLTLHVFSQKLFDPSIPVDFPELTPLGQGRAETRISLVRTTTRKVQWEASPTLIPLNLDATNSKRRHPAIDSPSTHNFRVVGQPWNLRIKVDSEIRSSQDYPQAKVLHASFFVNQMGDGSSRGQAYLDVEPIPGRFIALHFPGNEELLWAIVDGKSVQPIRQAPKTWIIPLNQAQKGRVVVSWRALQSEAVTPLQTVIVPSLEQPGVPFLLTTYSDESGRFRSGNLSMEPIRESVWWIEAANRGFRRLTVLAAEVDKSTSAGRDSLIEAIVEVLLMDRQARSTLRSEGENFRKVEFARLDDSATIFESGLRKLGLETLRKEALARVGQAGKGSNLPNKSTSIDLIEPVQLRRVGENVQRFRDFERSASVSPVLFFDPTQTSTVALWRSISIGVVVWSLLLGIIWISSNPAWRDNWSFRISLIVISVTCLFFAPFTLTAAILGFYAIGRVLPT